MKSLPAAVPISGGPFVSQKSINNHSIPFMPQPVNHSTFSVSDKPRLDINSQLSNNQAAFKMISC